MKAVWRHYTDVCCGGNMWLSQKLKKLRAKRQKAPNPNPKDGKCRKPMGQRASLGCRDQNGKKEIFVPLSINPQMVCGVSSPVCVRCTRMSMIPHFIM